MAIFTRIEKVLAVIAIWFWWHADDALSRDYKHVSLQGLHKPTSERKIINETAIYSFLSTAFPQRDPFITISSLIAHSMTVLIFQIIEKKGS